MSFPKDLLSQVTKYRKGKHGYFIFKPRTAVPPDLIVTVFWASRVDSPSLTSANFSEKENSAEMRTPLVSSSLLFNQFQSPG
ncbi:hypothetical protein ACLB2K_024157 [Fragaria x ananassa]